MSASNCYGYLPFMGFIQKIALYVQYPEYIQCPPSLTATNIKPTVSDGLIYILRFFYEPGEGVRNQNHLGWTGLCFANFKNPAGPNGPDLTERESRNLFFQGHSVLMCIMVLP